jgi:hypothetical protein
MIKILIPAFKEGKNIAKAINDFKKYGKAIAYGEKGKGNTVRKLLKEKSDIYVLVDGDDAFYAEDCNKMIDLVMNGKADMVIGKRINRDTHNKNSIFLRKMFLSFLELIFRLKYKNNYDFMSGYRVFNDKVKQKLDLKSKGFDIDTEITIQAIKNKFRIIEVPVKVKPRKSGKQKSNIINVGFPVLKRIIFS